MEKKEKNGGGGDVKLITSETVSIPAKKHVDHPFNLMDVKPVIEKFKYPIADHAALTDNLTGAENLSYKGSKVNVKDEKVKKAINRLPKSIFPINSSNELQAKFDKFFSVPAVKQERSASFGTPSN